MQKKTKSAHNRKIFVAARFSLSLEPFARLHHCYSFVPIPPFFFFQRSTRFSSFARLCASSLGSPPLPPHPLSPHPQTYNAPNFSILFVCSIPPAFLIFSILPIPPNFSPRTLLSSLFLPFFYRFALFSFSFTRSSFTFFLPGGFHPSYSLNCFYRLHCATGLIIIFREGFKC